MQAMIQKRAIKSLLSFLFHLPRASRGTWKKADVQQKEKKSFSIGERGVRLPRGGIMHDLARGLREDPRCFDFKRRARW
jgi:hypothetical protein